MPEQAQIVLCRCRYYQLIPERVIFQIEEKLASAGVAFDVADDLCSFAAQNDANLARWARVPDIRIAACFERAVRWLFHAADAPLRSDTMIFNLRTDPAPDSRQISAICEKLCDNPVKGQRRQVDCPPQEQAVIWFPVIDYQRCINCKQCLNFCLFGVYGLGTEGEVRVIKPAGCKKDCPACARICPQAAIIFPRYSQSPFNGDRIEPSDEHRLKSQLQLKELLGGDVHDFLRKRDASLRFQPGRVEQQKMLRLVKLHRQLGLPPEVVSELSKQLDMGQTSPTAAKSDGGSEAT